MAAAAVAAVAVVIFCPFLSPNGDPEIQQALLAYGLSLQTPDGETRAGLTIPLSLPQQVALSAVLFRTAWLGAEENEAAFLARATFWRDITPFNLRAIQLFAAEVIATASTVTDLLVGGHTGACMDKLTTNMGFDIGAQWAELFAARNSSDVLVTLKAFTAGDYDRIAAGLKKNLCKDEDTMKAIRRMGQIPPTREVAMNSGFFTLMFNKLVSKNLINEGDCRISLAPNLPTWETEAACNPFFFMSLHHVIDAVRAFYFQTPAQIVAAMPSSGSDHSLNGMRISSANMTLELLDADVQKALRIAKTPEGLKDSGPILEILFKDFSHDVIKVRLCYKY